MHIPFFVYVLLLLAVCCESLGASFLAKSNGLTIAGPVVISLCFLSVAFVLGGFIVKSMPVGIHYAIWSGLGIILSSVAGYYLNKQSLDTPALIGMSLIAAGVLVIYLFSKSSA